MLSLWSVAKCCCNLRSVLVAAVVEVWCAEDMYILLVCQSRVLCFADNTMFPLAFFMWTGKPVEAFVLHISTGFVLCCVQDL